MQVIASLRETINQAKEMKEEVMLMKHIKDMYFHIKGTPKQNETFKHVTDNYVRASLVYNKGKGYYLLIYRCGKYMLHNDYTGEDVKMESFSMGDRAPTLYECLVPCNRAGKAREREAVAVYISCVLETVYMIGYDIDTETSMYELVTGKPWIKKGWEE